VTGFQFFGVTRGTGLFGIPTVKASWMSFYNPTALIRLIHKIFWTQKSWGQALPMIRNTMWVLRGELIIPEYGPERRLFEAVANPMEVTVWNAFSGYAPGAFSKTVDLGAADLMAAIEIISHAFVKATDSG
jgi:hypothetical protein